MRAADPHRFDNAQDVLESNRPRLGACQMRGMVRVLREEPLAMEVAEHTLAAATARRRRLHPAADREIARLHRAGR